MEISVDQIADYLERMADDIRNGKLTALAAEVHTSLRFQSRPEVDKDNYRMQGGQTFRSAEDAAKFMHDGLGIFRLFDSATGVLTLRFDQTERIQELVKNRGPVQVKQWILDTHSDFTVPEFMKDVGMQVVAVEPELGLTMIDG